MSFSSYKRGFSALIAVFFVLSAMSQNIPESTQYVLIYDFLEELASDGVIEVNAAIKPYSRKYIASLLLQAQAKDSLLCKRQRDDLNFYMQDYALELDTVPDYKLYGHNNVCQWTKLRSKEAGCYFNLSLVEPSLHILTKDKKFKMMMKPILGMDLYASKKGIITKRWYGAELQMDIVNHVSIWGSLRDNSWKGYGALYGDPARITKSNYLNNLPGLEYKEAKYGGDFSDSKGGISIYSWWGSIGVQRESLTWGDASHCSNILSGHNPAVPMLTLQLTPCKWFQFDYFHAWLNSNVLDTTDFYVERDKEGVEALRYRSRSKYMAANMFTFMPVKYVQFSVGNSIVYAERNPHAAYFIPIAFYKSLDHLLTKGLEGTENQNSQAFASVTVRPTDHLRLYGSFYLDEFSLKRLKKSEPENNPISYLVGFNWSGWPVRGLSLKAEFMRSYIACYTHSIEVLSYTSNSFNMGHYMGDNAQSIFAELEYKPVRGLALKLNYTCDTKYKVFDYVRHGDIIDENGKRGISSIISNKPFTDRTWQNDIIGFDATYEIFNNCYAVVSMQYNNARTFNIASERKYGEDRGWDEEGNSLNLTGDDLSAYYLNKFSPFYFQGKNFTVMCGLNFSF